ncbi:MAG: GlxA family transcriptional regulator [Betaproteobacteria bacterium]|nr:GlxA family transcriptional regulator [Betaproteobacteria bacterium]
MTSPIPERIAFLLLPRFPLASLAGPLDALAHANAALGTHAHESLLVSLDGNPVTAGNGISLPVHCALSALASKDATALMVLSDTPLPQRGFDQEVETLRRFALPGRLVGGLGTGAWLVARAGLLTAKRATIHWPYAALFGETFAETVVSSNLFEIDDNRMTAAGGDAARDLFVHWLTTRHGDTVATALMDHFGLERRRGSGEAQRVPLAARIGGGQPKLTEAVSLMEANLEEPLPTEEIARLVGVSRRQLERLFKQYLNNLPSRYYLDLRLTRSRQLLTQTSQSILQIGLSCGFSSGPHFSSAYRAKFGITPREQRARRMGAVEQDDNDE